jgi:hypothetical protein
MKTLTIDLSKCFECDEPMKDMHHVVPKSKGGKRTLPLCAKCHGLVHDRNFVKHRQLQREGVERAKAEGKFKGRKKGTTDSDEKVLKRHKKIVEAIKENPNSSLRIIANTVSNSEYSVSPNTVKKVKDCLIKRNVVKPHVRNCVHENNKQTNKFILWQKNT